MSELGQKLRTITGILATILLVARIVTLFTGGMHHRVSYTPPPVASEPEAPQTEAEKKAAEEQGKSIASVMATAREFAYGQKVPAQNTLSHQ